MAFENREYQAFALKEIKEKWDRGVKKLLLFLATGGGKTHIFSIILTTCGLQCMMLVRGRELVENASKRLRREGVPHGVRMAGHWNYRPKERIQICSIDTLSRRKEFPKADLIVIDEVHFATSKKFREFMKNYPDAYILGVSATPYTRYGLGHVCESVVKPTTILKLIEEGYLVPPKAYSTYIPELKGVKFNDKDYDQKQLAEALDKGEIIGDIPEHWKRLGENRPSLGFAVNVKHSKDCAKAFNDAGIPSIHLDAGSTDEEREKGLEDLRTGKIKCIWNVDIFSTGKDIPFLGCVIMARTTKSLILYYQQAGRGTRTFDGDEFNAPKTDFVLLDHAGNIPRHGLPVHEYEPNLEKDEKKKRKYEASSPVKQCKVCFFIYEEGDVCPSCGNAKPPKTFQSKDGILKEIPFEEPEVRAFRELKLRQKREGRSRTWLRFRMLEKFGPVIAEKFVPKMSPAQIRAMERERRNGLTVSFNDMLQKVKNGSA